MSEQLNAGAGDLRPEWAELGVMPPHAACPIVQDIEAAHWAVLKAAEAGLISQRTEQQRIAELNLQRIAISAAQEQYGCPRVSQHSKNGEGCDEEYSCQLPTGLIELFAFGDPNHRQYLLSNVEKGRKVGF